MDICRPLPASEALQALFARAAARRAERGVFLRTLREILTRCAALEPLLLLRRERRRAARAGAQSSDPSYILDAEPLETPRASLSGERQRDLSLPPSCGRSIW